MSEEYMANVRSMDSAKRTSHLKKIENAFVKSREYGDDKVQLAMQTYEMVSTFTPHFSSFSLICSLSDDVHFALFCNEAH